MLALLIPACQGHAAATVKLTGLVVEVDRSHRSLVVSCDRVPNVMDAMVMSFSVRQAEGLEGVVPSAMIEFLVRRHGDSTFAEDIKVLKFDSAEQEPQEAQRLKLLHDITRPNAESSAITLGSLVPDFALTDQRDRRIKLSQFTGKIVVLTFIYTRCPNPTYCFRLNSNLARLRRRFSQQLGRNLILLSIVIDPEHDQQKALKEYSNIWKADPLNWHFLTGPLPDVQRVTRSYGMDFWSGEGTVTHLFHTIIIDQQRRLAANLEGNQFTPLQLGDLLENMLAKKR